MIEIGEINEAVALKLGWHPTEFQMNPEQKVRGWTRYDSDWAREHVFPGHVPAGCGIIPCDLPDYCHDIAAAWEVTEYLHSNNWAMTMETDFGGKGVEIFFTHQRNLGHGLTESDQHFNAESDTAPMAIALCFLKLHNNDHG